MNRNDKHDKYEDYGLIVDGSHALVGTARPLAENFTTPFDEPIPRTTNNMTAIVTLTAADAVLRDIALHATADAFAEAVRTLNANLRLEMTSASYGSDSEGRHRAGLQIALETYRFSTACIEELFK